MNNIGRSLAGRATSLTALTAVGVLAFSGIAFADNIQDTIADTGTGVTLVAGSATGGTAAIRVVGNNSDGSTTDPGCNWDTGENPLVLDVVTPAGVTATPDPLSITACGTDVPVTFKASATAVSGVATVTIVSTPAGGGAYTNQVSIPITVTHPNTAPVVSVAGVTDGGSYEIGTVPAAGCDVTDAEDSGESAAPVVTGTLSHGLGAQTVTCSYTDGGGKSASASATYTIVDTGDPSIDYTLNPASANANGWFKQDVTVDFTCADSGSGIDTCVGDTTLGEGATQSATGTATDWAGNQSTATAAGINIDKTKPTVGLSGGPAASGSYYFGDVPAAPECEASDTLSGTDGTCSVTGGGSTVGTHSYTATATDKAGNTQTASRSYTVLPWTMKGFYAPVDGNGVWNTAKGGSTIPLKFEMFAGTTELIDSSLVSLKVSKVTCGSGAIETDSIEVLSSGATALRYDTTGGQFIQNWKTPTGAGCYVATMTADDNISSITANFRMAK